MPPSRDPLGSTLARRSMSTNEKLQALIASAPERMRWTCECPACGKNVVAERAAVGTEGAHLAVQHDDPKCDAFENMDIVDEILELLAQRH